MKYHSEPSIEHHIKEFGTTQREILNRISSVNLGSPAQQVSPFDSMNQNPTIIALQQQQRHQEIIQEVEDMMKEMMAEQNTKIREFLKQRLANL